MGTCTNRVSAVKALFLCVPAAGGSPAIAALCTTRDNGRARASVRVRTVHRMTTLTKLEVGWKYRRQLWKYRKLIRRRREIAAIAVLAGIGAGIYWNRQHIEWLSAPRE